MPAECDVVADAATDLRPSGSCPLCGSPSRPLDSFEFAPRQDLPSVVRFETCDDCNFLFAGDISASSYRSYYASVVNDADHVVVSDDPDSNVRLQATHLADILAPTFDGRVLDFGCGQGRLLSLLANRYPAASFHGHDVADYLPVASNIRFVAVIGDCAERFDVIVLSHVVEHLVGFGILQVLERLLAPGGLMYVEVPNPLQYAACPRREYMYYFDRLHINHFSARAMRRLLGRFGLDVRRTGTHRFLYRDGLYPAMYCMASRSSDEPIPVADDARVQESDEGAALDSVYRDYRDDEQRRAREFQRRLKAEGGSTDLLVYGAGDNFHRARRIGGPLHAITLLAVMDQRADQLAPEEGIRFELPAVALERHPTAPVVITVSQRSEEIAAGIRKTWPDRRILFV